MVRLAFSRWWGCRYKLCTCHVLTYGPNFPTGAVTAELFFQSNRPLELLDCSVVSATVNEDVTRRNGWPISSLTNTVSSNGAWRTLAFFWCISGPRRCFPPFDEDMPEYDGTFTLYRVRFSQDHFVDVVPRSSILLCGALGIGNSRIGNCYQGKRRLCERYGAVHDIWDPPAQKLLWATQPTYCTFAMEQVGKFLR